TTGWAEGCAAPSYVVSAFRRTRVSGGPALMRHPVDDVVDAELVRFVRLIDRPQPDARPLPELRDVGVVVHDHLQPLARLVVLEDSEADGGAGIVGLRDAVERGDLEERVKNRL